jgi:hypothetical protein
MQSVSHLFFIQKLALRAAISSTVKVTASENEASDNLCAGYHHLIGIPNDLSWSSK